MDMEIGNKSINYKLYLNQALTINHRLSKLALESKLSTNISGWFMDLCLLVLSNRVTWINYKINFRLHMKPSLAQIH